MYLTLIFYFFTGLSATPVLLKKAVDNDIEKLDNSLPKSNDFSKFHYSTQEDAKTSEENIIDFKEKSKESAKTFDVMADIVKDGAAAGVELLKDLKNVLRTLETTTFESTTLETTTIGLDEVPELDPVFLDDDNDTISNRTIRQEESTGEGKDDKEKENQENDEEEEEEPNMITGLISAFLGGLSRPDGSVDVEAITGLLGSLSSQKEDGSYDFNGLTELLMSFFGGEGGSDFGAFFGGLLGAFIKGIANPPGAQGAGSFLGNLVGAILPGLSAPAPSEDENKPQQGLDSGGFLSGLLSSLLSNLGMMSNSSSGGADAGGGGSKFSLFKGIFSVITSIFSSSSGAPSH